jgi:arginine utilization protein RocB
MIINRIYETQNLLSLQLVSFLVGLRTYQLPCISIIISSSYSSSSSSKNKNKYKNKIKNKISDNTAAINVY